MRNLLPLLQLIQHSIVAEQKENVCDVEASYREACNVIRGLMPLIQNPIANDQLVTMIKDLRLDEE